MASTAWWFLLSHMLQGRELQGFRSANTQHLFGFNSLPHLWVQPPTNWAAQLYPKCLHSDPKQKLQNRAVDPAAYQLFEEGSLLMLLGVTLILIQSILQLQGQRVIVGAYHFQNLPKTVKCSRRISAGAFAQPYNKAGVDHISGTCFCNINGFNSQYLVHD